MDRATLQKFQLQSEILRSYLVIGGCAMFALIYLATYPWLNPELERIFRIANAYWIVLTILAAFCIYELIIVGALKKKVDRRWFQIIRVVNTIQEISCPTLFMIIATQFVEQPIYTLVAPPVFFYAPILVLGALRMDLRLSILAGVVAGIQYQILSGYLLASNTVDLPLVMTLPHIYGVKALMLAGTGVLAGYVARDISNRISSIHRIEKDRTNIYEVFGQHVSPKVVETLLNQNHEQNNEYKFVSVLFLDLCDFTSFSEGRRPHEVVVFLNSLFEFMVESVDDHGGIVNKFLGDGFMAIFGAPVDDGKECQNAVAAAIAIKKRLDSAKSEGHFLEAHIRIGIHAGEVITGNIGSKSRKEYTIIGDVVNLASRIEQLNKTIGSQILVSSAVIEKLQEASKNFPESTQEIADIMNQLEALGQFPVKGRAASVEVFRVA